MPGAPQGIVYGTKKPKPVKDPKIYGMRYTYDVKFFDMTYDTEMTYERRIVPTESTKIDQLTKMDETKFGDLLTKVPNLTDIDLKNRNRIDEYDPLYHEINRQFGSKLLTETYSQTDNIYINIADSNYPLCIGRLIYSVKAPIVDTRQLNIRSQNVRLYDMYFYNYKKRLLYRILIYKTLQSRLGQTIRSDPGDPYSCVVFQRDTDIPFDNGVLISGTGTLASSGVGAPDFPFYNIMCNEKGEYITTGKYIHSFFSQLINASPEAALLSGDELSSGAAPPSGGRKRRSSRRRKSSRKSRKSRRR